MSIFDRPPAFLEKQKEFFRQEKENFKMGDRNFIYKTKIDLFIPRDGDNIVRILPGAWKGAIGYGLHIWQHWIGTERSAFLCLQHMQNIECPICDAAKAAARTGNKEAASAFSPNRKVLAYVIDRKAEEAGPLVWSMPYSRVYAQLIIQSDRRSGEFMYIDDLIHGRDVLFSKKGKGLATTYDGLHLDLEEGPLHQDKDKVNAWTKFIQEHPIPDLLQYKSPEHIRNVLLGGDNSEANTEDVITSNLHRNDKSQSNTRVTNLQAEHDTPVSLTSLDREGLIQFIKTKQLDIRPEEWDDDNELRDAIKLELGLNQS